MRLEQEASASTVWWQPFALDDGDCRKVAVGPLTVFVQRLADQWLLASRYTEGAAESDVSGMEAIESLPDDLVPTRFVFRQAPTCLHLQPKLLDRPVVVRTSHPVRIPPGESITFFISSPICISVTLPDLHLELEQLVTLRLSDTWFGPSTQVGSLCYAARTLARISRNEVPQRAHRAVTPVTIKNQAVGFLAVEKLSIPLPYLALYASDDGALWTDPVELTHVQGNPLTNFTIGRTGVTQQTLSEARIALPKGGLVRTFTNMFTQA